MGGASGAGILFVSDERGWPRRSGYRRRTAQIVSTLASLDSVTWIVAPRNRFDDGSPVEVPIDLRAQIDPVLVPAPTRSRAATASRWLSTGLPWPLAAGDWSDVTERLGHLADERDGPFDVLWAMGIDALTAARRAGIEARVTVVDADLESVKLERRLELEGVRSPLRQAIARIDVGRWRRAEQRADASVSGFSVCSERERDLLGGSAFVTPNSYDGVEPAAVPPVGRDRDTLLFIGALGYGPNVDGLRWFMAEVLPEIRRHRPAVSLRVVGSGPRPHGADHPGVELVGALDDLTSELAGAGAVVVPVRWGAGTRIKILEAFAHRAPVVSTPIGAEGLDITHGRHLLIAEGAQSFAEACLSLLDRPDRADALAERAAEHFLATYEESVVSHRLGLRLRALLADAQPPRAR